MQYFLVGKSDYTSSTLFSRQVHVLLLLLWVAFFWVCTFTQVHKLCTFTCPVYISFDGTERDGCCCGLGRPFCSDFSAVGDVLHFHFAQGYRLDVKYFVSTSESDTLILDMNHDGDWFTKETWWFIDWFTIMIHITKMSVWFTGTHYSRYITAATIPFSAIKGYVYEAGKSTKFMYLSKRTLRKKLLKVEVKVHVLALKKCTWSTITFTDQKVLHWLDCKCNTSVYKPGVYIYYWYKTLSATRCHDMQPTSINNCQK